jgi:hypothetical protein
MAPTDSYSVLTLEIAVNLLVLPILLCMGDGGWHCGKKLLNGFELFINRSESRLNSKIISYASPLVAELL